MAFFESAKKKAKVVVMALTLAATAAGAYAGSGKLIDVVTAKKTQRWEQRVSLAKRYQTGIQSVQQQLECSLDLLRKAEKARIDAEKAERRNDDFATELSKYELALSYKQDALKLLKTMDIDKLQGELQKLKQFDNPEDETFLKDQELLLERIIWQWESLMTLSKDAIDVLQEKINALRIRIAFKKK